MNWLQIAIKFLVKIFVSKKVDQDKEEKKKQFSHQAPIQIMELYHRKKKTQRNKIQH